MPDLSGQSIGRYHIIEPLGEGGMATVYKAFDTRLEADVAIKIIRIDGLPPAMRGQALKRFEREAKSLARLTHPNIVKVTDYGEHEGQPYLAMEYLPGGTLKEHLSKPIPWLDAARTLLPIARALEFAHQQGIIHRDIKPSNILFTKSGEPMLTDFGVAKILDDSISVELTGTSMSIGTPAYMAPEQARAKNVDGRADIYSLGIVFYEMVTGRRPFEADTPLAVILKHASDPLPRPSQFVSGLPGVVEKVLFKALAKKPESRYQTMGEFATAVEKIATDSRSSVIGKRKIEKTESKKEDLEKATVRVAPTVIATTAESKKPARPVLSLTLLIPLGILVVILAISIPLGIRYLKPVTENQTPLGGLATDTVLFTALPTFTLSPTFTPTDTLMPTSTITPSPTVTVIPVLGIGSTWTRPADGMTMVYVPEGNFLMGSNSGDDNEKPIHTVYLDAFWIDQTEVTNIMYSLCVNEGICNPPLYGYYGDSQYDAYPAFNVDWNQANTYCQWAGARLPTEAEWEKAARGTDGRTYPWGEEIDCQKANYSGCGENPSRVGSYRSGKSPYGAYDMAGNVWEWVADWYSYTYYEVSPQKNPMGPISGEFQALRGGSVINNAYILRSAYRSWGGITGGNPIGFRCSRSAK